MDLAAHRQHPPHLAGVPGARTPWRAPDDRSGAIGAAADLGMAGQGQPDPGLRRRPATGGRCARRARPAAGLALIAAELRSAYERLIAPHWPRIQATLDADVLYRTRQLAIGGAENLLTGLHADVRWREGRLMLVGRRWPLDLTVHRGPGGLVLMSVALGSPHILVKKRTSTQTTVRYPARGIAGIWTAGNRQQADGAVR